MSASILLLTPTPWACHICCSLEFQHIGVAQQEYICIPVLQVESQFKCCRERVRTLMHVHAFRAVLSFFQDASNLLSDQNFRILNSKSAGNRSILKQMISQQTTRLSWSGIYPSHLSPMSMPITDWWVYDSITSLLVNVSTGRRKTRNIVPMDCSTIDTNRNWRPASQRNSPARIKPTLAKVA